MAGRSSSIPTTSGDSNQPIDLAQKSHCAKSTSAASSGTSSTLVHFGNGQFITSSTSSSFSAMKQGTKTDSIATVALIPRQTSSVLPSVSTPVSSSGMNPPNSSLIRSVYNPPTTSLTIVSSSSAPTTITVPSGYHIPRGAAVVANMTASRSPNLASIVKTTSQGIGVTTSSSVTTSRSSLMSQRVVPISSGSWINRPSSTSALTTRVTTLQIPGRATITTARPSQTPVMPVTTYHSSTVKPGTIVTGNIKSSGPPGMRIATGNEGFRPQSSKGLHISHPMSHGAQKYIGAGVGGTIRSLTPNTLVSHGTGSGGLLYTPTSTLVTSLASSGTTITPHPGNKSHPSPNAVRISTGVSSPFSQSSNQPNPLFGEMNLTTASGGTTLTSSSRNQTREHVSIKTPIVRASYNSSQLPVGTQISFSTPKVIANSQGQPLTLAQLSNAASSTPFQSRAVTTVAGSNIGRVVGSVPPSSSILATTHSTPDTQTSHTSVFLHCAPQSGTPATSAVVVTHADRGIATVPPYNIAPPYYLESQNKGSFTVNASIIPSSHYLPTTAAARGGGGGGGTAIASTDSTLPVLKPNSSPRPSILRKRSDIDGSPLKAAKNLTTALSLPISSPPSPKRPDSRGNGNISSGSTTLSASSSPGFHGIEEDSLSKHDVSLRSESLEDNAALCLELGGRDTKTIRLLQSSGQLPMNVDGVSPRKKPRKQQLMGNELHEARICEEVFEPPFSSTFSTFARKRKESNLTPTESDEEGNGTAFRSESPEDKLEVSHSPDSPPRPPRMSLLGSYRQSWKSRHNHFVKHSDVRPKEEKKRTVNEIANQKMAMQRVNGWKVMHISGQVEDLVDTEAEVAHKLRLLLRAIEKRQQQRKPYKDFDKDVERLSELVKANIQRSIIIRDQMADAKMQMSKIFDHKENIVDILTKYNSKRTLRKKDRL